MTVDAFLEKDARTIGTFMYIIGIAILFFTLIEAYSLFSNIAQGANMPVNQSQTYNLVTGNVPITNQSQAVQGGLIYALSKLPLNKYFSYMLMIVLIAVFASIGFKLARLGIYLMLRDTSAKAEKEK